MQFLTKNEFIRMFIYAKEEIESKKEEINKINVFPVPDQDTGRNLLETLKGIVKVIEENKNRPFKNFLERILEGALISSQGNSGLIFTSFLAGFTEKLAPLGEPVDAKKLSFGFEKGNQKAKESIEKPQKGTILDVISSFCFTFKKEVKKTNNILFLFKKALQKAHQSLIETQKKLPILEKAGVVDAGGLGMFLIFKGWLEGLLKKKERKVSTKIEKRKFFHLPTLKYELIFLIKNPKKNTKYFGKKFSLLGNSLEILKVKDLLKIHIHTNFPEKVIEIAKKEGEILDLKIENLGKVLK